MQHPAVNTPSLMILVALGCGCALADEPVPVLNPKDKLIVETVLRLKNFDMDSSAPAKAAILRYLRAQPGTDQYFELISRFQPAEMADDLARFSLAHAAETSGVRGAELLFAMGREQTLLDVMHDDDRKSAVAAVTLIGHAGGKRTRELLGPLVTAPTQPLAVRAAAVAALGRRPDGQKTVLEVVATGRLPDDLKFAAANLLLSSADDAIKQQAAKHLQLPATADSRPLPPTTELVKQRGDVAAGAVVFRQQGKCIICHKVRGEGKDVGPDLSEIGSKLSRDAMYVSILDPGAAISHNFESYALVTEDGLIVVGLLVSETDEFMTLRTHEGIDRKFDKTSIEEFRKLKVSLMPTDLQRQLTVNQLVDLVEYALSLRKVGSSPVSESSATGDSQPPGLILRPR